MQSGGRGRPTSAHGRTVALAGVAAAAAADPAAPAAMAGSPGRPFGKRFLADKLRSSGAGELQVGRQSLSSFCAISYTAQRGFWRVCSEGKDKDVGGEWRQAVSVWACRR